MYPKFITHLVNKGYSKRTVEIIHDTMYAAIEKARVLQKIEQNPCRGAEITTKKTSKKEELQYIPSEQIGPLLKECYQYDYIYWIFLKVLVETGKRKGEAAALQWSDIDLKEGTIYINKTLDFQAREGEGLFGATKTLRSARRITIGKSLIRVLHDHIKWQNQDKLILNDMYKHELNLVLCRKVGNFMPKSTLFNAFLDRH